MFARRRLALRRTSPPVVSNRSSSPAPRVISIPHPFATRFVWMLLMGWLACWSVVTNFALGKEAQLATGQHGIAATVHPLASAAAVQTMRDGGNAIDAAVAAALTLGVVDGENSGLGGGCFFLVRRPDHTIVAFDGREEAPAAATRDMFVRDGKARPDLSQTGALAAGIPGSLAVYDQVLRNYGKKTLAYHLENAARLARDGFPVGRALAARLAEVTPELKKFASSRTALLKADQTPYAVGEFMKQPDLARSYEAIAQSGISWFYGGAFANATADWMKANGGIITAQDFQRYQIKVRHPILTTYRGYQILGFPPPSSGGVHVAQILNILERFDLHRMGPNSADFIHVVTEAMKLAFADRAYWLGDPDFAPVPKGLVDKSYGTRLAQRIDMKHASVVPQHDIPDEPTERLFEKHTTHFSTADADGNWVACTATVNTTFGSKVVVPDTGLVLNNQMDDFSIQPGQQNFFGLVGSSANAVAARKRPLSSMSPTLVLKDGRPVLCLGAAGGPTIISQTLLAILYTVDFGLPLTDALNQTRFHHQWQPDELLIEKTVSPRVQRELEQRGHHLKVIARFGSTQAIGFGGPRKLFIGSADPRGEGIAEAY